MDIPDITNLPYACAENISPLIRRVLARNASPFSYTGTQTYIVGKSDVAVIDPGPLGDDPAHVEALTDILAGERIVAIMCTHTHRDHSPAAEPLKAATGAPIIGCAPLVIEDSGPRADLAFDATYTPDQVLENGETVCGPGWSLRALATPGHTSNHLCFALNEEQALFTGDHIMGWSTTVVSPPDGDMAAYMRSLELLMARDDRIYYPAHGPAMTTPQRTARAHLAHRKQREAQILKLLREGVDEIPALVARMYVGLDPRLHGAAGRSVLAHLIDLHDRDVVTPDGDNYGDNWSLTK
ncbi:MAG: MBL fold metallo-hydrolase [Alphaproteobacteria bacterium]|nr:MBL fold metallo-hydrolase [Alphaproteobacteria bacterium]MDE2339967.1 MBL fold metallo-hydrolase [Alphaproteobacteria bacterium]